MKQLGNFTGAIKILSSQVEKNKIKLKKEFPSQQQVDGVCAKPSRDSLAPASGAHLLLKAAPPSKLCLKPHRQPSR